MDTAEGSESLFDPHAEYGSEDLLSLTFGPVSKDSIPGRLCTSVGELDDLIGGTGRFGHLRSKSVIANGEMYRYLRLGVGYQSAVALRSFGYPTAESLTQSPEIAAMLPDVLIREGHSVPLALIDRCEQEGMSAVLCQWLIRRGVTDEHLDLPFGLHDLVLVIRRHLKRKGILSDDPARKPTAVDYVFEGIVPVEVVIGDTKVASHRIVQTVDHLREQGHGAFLGRLQADPDLFRRFALKLDHNAAYGADVVLMLRQRVEAYGEEVLHLDNPYLCGTAFGEDESGTPVIPNIADARFIESLAVEARLYPADKALRSYEHAISYRDCCLLRRAGVTTTEVCERVIDGKMSVEVLLKAKEAGIHGSLTGGLL